VRFVSALRPISAEIAQRLVSVIHGPCVDERAHRAILTIVVTAGTNVPANIPAFSNREAFVAAGVIPALMARARSDCVSCQWCATWAIAGFLHCGDHWEELERAGVVALLSNHIQHAGVDVKIKAAVALGRIAWTIGHPHRPPDISSDAHAISALLAGARRGPLDYRVTALETLRTISLYHPAWIFENTYAISTLERCLESKHAGVRFEAGHIFLIAMQRDMSRFVDHGKGFDVVCLRKVLELAADPELSSPHHAHFVCSCFELIEFVVKQHGRLVDGFEGFLLVRGLQALLNIRPSASLSRAPSALP